MPTRLVLAAVLAACAILAVPGAAQAAPGALNILVTGNGGGETNVATALLLESGVATADTFDSSTGTPTAADLATRDLVVSTGDSSYADPALWGNRLADYVDSGGAVVQAAYDNWIDDPDAHVTGRFQSGGYPPLLLGDNDNLAVTLGEILVPSSPIVQGLGTFPNSDNTTTPLAPGATLLARWSDDRNAIAIKNRVVATSSALQVTAAPDIAQLAVNTANFMFTRYRLSVVKAGAGTGTVTSAPAGIACGADCSENVLVGRTVRLAATPGPNSAFVGFVGACFGTAPCTRTINSAVNVGAVFVSTARCGNPQRGTAAANALTGSVLGDRLTGLGGNDTLRGLAGDDCLSGNGGRDRLVGDAGADRLSGGSGGDRGSGGVGRDRLSGGSGADRLSGGASRDRLSGGSGNDRLGGGGAGDRISGGGGSDRVSGNSGNDRINVRDNRVDRVNCGSGSDRVKADDEDVLVNCETVSRG